MAVKGNPDLVPEDVRQNYAQLWAEGREWDVMADTAERSNDPHLAAHLREQAAKERDGRTADGGKQSRSTPPVGRSTGPRADTGVSK